MQSLSTHFELFLVYVFPLYTTSATSQALRSMKSEFCRSARSSQILCSSSRVRFAFQTTSIDDSHISLHKKDAIMYILSFLSTKINSFPKTSYTGIVFSRCHKKKIPNSKSVQRYMRNTFFLPTRIKQRGYAKFSLHIRGFSFSHGFSLPYFIYSSTERT